MSLKRSYFRRGPGARPVYCLHCGTEQKELWAPPIVYSGRSGGRRESVACAACGEEHVGEYTTNMVGWRLQGYWKPLKGIGDEMPRPAKLP